MNTRFLTKGLLTHKMEGHLVPSEMTQLVFRQIYDIIQPNSIVEIGFNAGHSAYMALMMLPDVKVHAIDICTHSYAETNAKKLEEMFPERFRFTKADSKDLLSHEVTGDVIFIDGDHSVKGFSSDLRLANESGFDWILVDDYHSKWFRVIIELTAHFMKKPDFNYTLVRTWDYESRDGENTVALLRREK